MIGQRNVKNINLVDIGMQGFQCTSNGTDGGGIMDRWMDQVGGYCCEEVTEF